MIIRKFKRKDTAQIADVIKSTFMKYNGSEGSKVSVKKYIARYAPDKLSELENRLEKDKIVLVVIDGKRIVGVVRGNEHRVFQLFVDKDYHGQGLGKKLMDSFETEVRGKGTKVIQLRSSLYAINFYEHRGYKKTTGLRTSHQFGDIRYQPMKKELA